MKTILVALSLLFFSFSLQAGGNTTFYGEFGLTDRLTAIVYSPLFSRSYFNNEISGTTGALLSEGESIIGVGDTDISLKYGLTKGKGIAIAATVTLGLPIGNDSGGSQGNLQIGENGYANVYVGFNNRTNGFSDEFRYGFEAGLNLLDNKLTVIARFIGIKSFRNGLLSGESSSTSIFANNAEFFSFSPEIAWNIKENWGIAAGLGSAISGRIIYANTSYNVGVFFKW